MVRAVICPLPGSRYSQSDSVVIVVEVGRDALPALEFGDALVTPEDLENAADRIRKVDLFGGTHLGGPIWGA